MKNSQLDELAGKAYKLAHSGLTATDAAVQVLKGRGLLKEGVQRVCGALNRRLLESHKREAYSKNSSPLWSHDWETAKPENVCAELGIDVPAGAAASIVDDAQSALKTSAPDYRATLHALASQRPLRREVLAKTSSPRRPERSAPAVRSLEAIFAPVQEQLHRHGEAVEKISAMHEAQQIEASLALDRVAEMVTSSEELSPGEALWGIKVSAVVDDAAWSSIFAKVSERLGILESDFLGTTRRADGHYATKRIERARRLMGVRAELEKNSGVRVMTSHPLIQAAQEYGRVSAMVKESEAAVKYLHGVMEQWLHAAKDETAGSPQQGDGT